MVWIPGHPGCKRRFEFGSKPARHGISPDRIILVHCISPGQEDIEIDEKLRIPIVIGLDRLGPQRRCFLIFRALDPVQLLA